MSDATVLDRPEQISAWQFMSAISQLGLELSTGANFYGSRGSVLKGIQRRGWTSQTGRATKQAKALALAELLATADASGLGDGPVCTRARGILETACAELGIAIEVVPA